MKKALRGKTALVVSGLKTGGHTAAEGCVLAQFDDVKTVYRNQSLGFGWHQFKVEEFRTL